jgi:hypothetical protein
MLFFLLASSCAIGSTTGVVPGVVGAEPAKPTTFEYNK